MTMLHIFPDERGTWRVVEDESTTPLSEHASATGAELAAWRHAEACDAEAIVVHDRYHRVRALARRRFTPGTRSARPVSSPPSKRR